MFLENLPETAARLYALIIAIVIVFQCCLIAGAPWGHLTQGGQQLGKLTMAGRVMAFVSIPLLLGMGGSIMSAAGLSPAWPVWSWWLALGFQALITLLNWITRSVAERKLWAPITSVMLGLAAYVVLTAA